MTFTLKKTNKIIGGKMNNQKRVSLSVVLICLLASFWVTASERGNNPVAVSPGGDSEVAEVWQSCPTFSWSAVEQAKAYRIAVFETTDPKVRSYEDMTIISSPAITKEIQGPALSWTLSADQKLKTGSMMPGMFRHWMSPGMLLEIGLPVKSSKWNRKFTLPVSRKNSAKY